MKESGKIVNGGMAERLNAPDAENRMFGGVGG
jgi:hypothetical protein